MTVGIVEIATFNPITGVSHFFRAIIVTAMMGAPKESPPLSPLFSFSALRLRRGRSESRAKPNGEGDRITRPLLPPPLPPRHHPQATAWTSGTPWRRRSASTP